MASSTRFSLSSGFSSDIPSSALGVDGADEDKEVNTQHRQVSSTRLTWVENDKDKRVTQVHYQDEKKSTFVDAAAMKEKVREKLTRRKYNVFDLYHEKGRAQAIAKTQIFDRATLSVIAFNAVWIAIDTDMNHATLLSDAKPIFLIAENFFCFYFFAEWMIRFLAFSKKLSGLKDGWFVFDSFMVAMMVLETWVFTILMTVVGVSGSSGAGNVGIMRLARLLRLCRMARMGKLLRLMPELMIMIKGMKAAARSVFFTLVLLFVIVYVFAIAFVQLSEETEVGMKHFEGVPQSMYSLMMYGVFLDNVGILTLKMFEEPILLALFFGFVLLASFTVMNMLIGVLCEVVSAVAATEQEEMLVNYVNEKIQTVMEVLDTDGSGMVSKAEFCGLLEHDQAVRCLNDVGVDVFALIDLADYIFNDDDPDAPEEIELDFTRFMEVVLALRGTNQATVKDILDLRKFMRLSLKENYQQTQMVLSKLNEGASLSRQLMSRVSTAVSFSGSHSDSADRKSNCTNCDTCSVEPRGSRATTASVATHASFTVEAAAGDPIPAASAIVCNFSGSELEDNPLPKCPPPTPSGQLLCWVPAGSADEFKSTGEWEPCTNNFAVLKAIPEGTDRPATNPQGTPAAGRVGLLDHRRRDGHAELDSNNMAISTKAVRTPQPEVVGSDATAALVNSELQALGLQFEWVCRQLAIDLGEAINAAGKSVEQAHATKLANVMVTNDKVSQSIML